MNPKVTIYEGIMQLFFVGGDVRLVKPVWDIPTALVSMSHFWIICNYFLAAYTVVLGDTSLWAKSLNNTQELMFIGKHNSSMVTGVFGSLYYSTLHLACQI